MINKEIRAELEKKFDIVSLRNGVWQVKQSYFWGVSKSGEHLWNGVKELIADVELIEYGNHFHDFVGGAKAGSSQDSYFWCKFTVDNCNK